MEVEADMREEEGEEDTEEGPIEEEREVSNHVTLFDALAVHADCYVIIDFDGDVDRQTRTQRIKGHDGLTG